MKLLLGDSLDILKILPANSVDSVVTDPPYGLAFMNKHWDYDVPSVELWREVLRVLKPGGHLLSFGGTRTYHRMVVAIEDAGFEIRDQVMWIYGSGFPKSHNTGNGWGTALKPANEPIVLARKPLAKGHTVAANVLAFGTGAINVDASRIDGKPRTTHAAGNVVTCEAASGHMKGKKPHGPTTAPEGRWPANVLFDEEAAAALDEQTQHLHGAGKARIAAEGTHSGPSGMFGIGEPAMRFGDTGGASRFFYVAKASKRERNAGLEGMPELKHETYKNGEHSNKLGRSQTDTLPQKNNHPTVKPIKLMEYLVRMITPPGGIVLDPFMGSGTTGCAAKSLGFDFIGIEREPEYLSIATKRIEYWANEYECGDTDESDQVEMVL